MTTLAANTAISAPVAPLGLWDKLVAAVALIGASNRVCHDINARRAPAAADLELLGIDPAAIRGIR